MLILRAAVLVGLLQVAAPSFAQSDSAWTIDAGAVILTRSTPDAGAIVQPLGGGAPISRAEDFDFNWGAGPEISIARRVQSGDVWQVRYFGAMDFESEESFGEVPNFRLGSFSNFGATSLSARYDSTLHSTEVNWLRPVGRWFTFLAGFRSIELHDELTYHVTFPAFSANYIWNEDNHLYGGQLGGVISLYNPGGPLSVDCTLKAGVYENFADNDFTLATSIGGAFEGAGYQSEAAFAGEINFTAVYRFTASWAFRGGYQLLWLDGVALASDQAAAATANLTQNAIDNDGDVFYHGAILGLEFTR